MAGYFGWCPEHAKQLFTSRKQARRALRERCHVGKRAYPCEAVADMWHIGAVPQAVKYGVKSASEIYGRASE